MDRASIGNSLFNLASSGTRRRWTAIRGVVTTAADLALATRPTLTSVDLQEARQGHTVARRPTRRQLGVRHLQPGRLADLLGQTTGAMSLIAMTRLLGVFWEDVASPPAHSCSTVFSRWHQCARPPNIRFFGPTPRTIG